MASDSSKARGLSTQTPPTVSADADGRAEVPVSLSAVVAYLFGPDTGSAEGCPAARPGPPPGSLLGRYRVRKYLGHGGMGAVVQAHDAELDREVAIKVLLPGRFDAAGLERFAREAKAAAKLSHPHLVRVFDVGEQDGHPWMAMEYVGGGNLAAADGRFREPRRAATLLAQIARAVHHAHSRGVLHRDLKPGNIFLNERDEPLVGDFGLAKLTDPVDSTLTRTDAFLGTPAYMAPEQIDRPGAVTPAADVWALGVILYELLTARRPFEGSAREVMERLRSEQVPPRPRHWLPRLDRHLEAVVLKCLARDPARRYPTAAALADDLERWLRGEPIRPPWREPWVSRGRRWARRHPAVCTAVVLLGLAAATVGLAATFWDFNPDRSPTALDRFGLEAELRPGRQVELLGEQGLPRWYQWRAGWAKLDLPAARQRPLEIQAWDTTLLDLLADPTADEYEFRAEVRLLDTNPSGAAGIFFACQQLEGLHGPEHFFVALVLDKTARRFVAQVSRYTARGPGGQPLGTDAELRTCKPHQIDCFTQGAWCRLQARVTPEKVTVRAQDVLVGEWGRAELSGRYAYLFVSEPKSPLKATARFPPRGAAGLFALRSQAAFRSAVVTTEPGPSPTER